MKFLENGSLRIETLLNRPRDIGFDNTFYNQSTQEKLEMDHESHDNPDLNAPISF